VPHAGRITSPERAVRSVLKRRDQKARAGQSNKEDRTKL
jgi:hypothetical protein